MLLRTAPVESFVSSLDSAESFGGGGVLSELCQERGEVMEKACCHITGGAKGSCSPHRGT
jgi:hypothetical protein